MFRHPLFFKKSPPAAKGGRAKSTLTTASFFLSGILMGACIYITCMKGIGMGSSPQMAKLFPLFGITMYAILIMMITDGKNDRNKFRISIASLILTSIAFVTAILMDDY